MSIVSFQNVSKVFKDGQETITAVDDVSIAVEDGEFLVLVGPSGSGKSTLLRMLAGLESIDEGKISIGKTVVNDLEPRQRNIAMVFQNFALYPNMTVRGNMSFGLKMSSGLDSDRIQEAVENAAEMLEIDELLDNNPGQLSGGEKQRVALGRAIIRDPEVFLMDEPLSNLDAKLRTSMRTEIQRIQEELGVTTIYVTHDQTEAMTMGDRIAIMNSGVLQQIGTPFECFYHPENRFVAGFIGSPSMNFFEVTLEDRKLTGEGIEFEVPPTMYDNLDGVTDLTLGVRPSDLEIITSGGKANLTCEVDIIEPMGTEKLVYLNVNGREATVTVRIDATQSIANSQSLWLRIPQEAVHLFERDSGRALHNADLGEHKNVMSDFS